MTETITTPPASVKLPNGNTGLRIASGDVLDPAFVSLSNLVRMSEGTLGEVLDWLQAERERVAGERAKRLAGLEETTAQIRRDAEARAAQFERIKEETPWKLD
jgi:hypothetical protein